MNKKAPIEQRHRERARIALGAEEEPSYLIGRFESVTQALADTEAELETELAAIRDDFDAMRSLVQRAAQFTFDAQVLVGEDLEALANGLHSDCKAALDATESGGSLVNQLRTRCETLELSASPPAEVVEALRAYREAAHAYTDSLASRDTSDLGLSRGVAARVSYNAATFALAHAIDRWLP